MDFGEALKYLGGGTIVYVVVAACAASSPSTKAQSHDAGAETGGASGVDANMVDTGIDQFIDQIADHLADPVPEAEAGTDPPCAQWEVDHIEGYNAKIDPGWEPYAVTEGFEPDNQWYRYTHVRRCVP